MRDCQAELHEAREEVWDEGEAIGAAKKEAVGVAGDEAIGLARSEAIGVARGLAKIFGNLLLMHFTAVPDWAAQAIAQGTEDDLKRWSARLVKAKVFREVFADVITIPPNTC